MKVSIEIECTPAEARQFFGLPNVEPMQAAVMEQFQNKMLAEMDRISPEFVMQTWLSLMPSGAEQMQKLFTEMFKRKGSAQRNRRGKLSLAGQSSAWMAAPSMGCFKFPQPHPLNRT